MTLEQNVAAAHWSMNAWYVQVAKFLGWSEPGFVIVLTIVILIFGALFLAVWLIIDFPIWIAAQRRKHTGFLWYFWGVILFVSVILAVLLNMIIVIGFWLGMLGLAGVALRHITRH
jgi:hypothetical protein